MIFNCKKMIFGVGLFGSGLIADDMTKRFELTLERVLQCEAPAFTDDFVLADAVPQHVRRFTEFSGDVSGRYIGALSTVEQFSGKQFPELDRVVSKLVKLQQTDGHFGSPFSANEVDESDMALLWGNGRLLIGLLEYYRVKPSSEVLTCARRLGDFFLTLGPRLNDPAIVKKYSGNQMAVGYICWTQIIEGLVALTRATSEEHYLRLAEEIAANTNRTPNQHSHGFVSSLRGILELYKITHNLNWLQKVETEWDGILTSGNLMLQGALPEIFKPGVARDEGCSEADWLRLNLGLWTETRNMRYLEYAERTLFNGFSFNQFQNGDFGHHTLTSTGIGSSSAHAWWCCTFHGLRTFPDVFNAAFHAEPTFLCYDLPVEGQGSFEGLTMQANSTLEQDAVVTLTVTKSDGRELPLRVRQPAWVDTLELELNHHPITGITVRGYLEVRSRWRRGDTLTIRYPLRTRLVSQAPDSHRFAIMRGPWVLGVDAQHAPRYFDEPFEKNRIILPTPTNGDEVALKLVAGKPGAAAFTVPISYVSLAYLPGGYPVQPQTVILRPIAECTTLADGTKWAFWFESKSGTTK